MLYLLEVEKRAPAPSETRVMLKLGGRDSVADGQTDRQTDGREQVPRATNTYTWDGTPARSGRRLQLGHASPFAAAAAPRGSRIESTDIASQRPRDTMRSRSDCRSASHARARVGPCNEAVEGQNTNITWATERLEKGRRGPAQRNQASGGAERQGLRGGARNIDDYR